jgi:hypothetical protein
MNPQPPEIPESDPQLPEPLVRELAALNKPGIDVPRAIDAAVLLEARRHLRAAPMRRLTFRRLAPWAAAAAAVGLLAWLAPMPFRDEPKAPAIAGDFDRSGRVDILDALALAKRLDDPAKLDPGFDINGDGVVDRSDVDAIGHKAVALPATGEGRG